MTKNTVRSMILKINKDNPQRKHILMVVQILRGDGVIIFPTDTHYAIGCSLFSKKGIERLYKIKRADRTKLMSIICSDVADIGKYGGYLSGTYFKIIKRVLPGPYTFIIEASPFIPKIMLTKRKTIGVRIPDNKIALSIVRELGNPILCSSVTPKGGELLMQTSDLVSEYESKTDIIIDGGSIISEPSTVIDITASTPEIIREGKGDLSLFVKY